MVLAAPGVPRSSESDVAEGYRYLSRLARAGLEVFVEGGDPLEPSLCAIADGLRAAPVKLGCDSPDNLYQSAQLDSGMWLVVDISASNNPP